MGSKHSCSPSVARVGAAAERGPERVVSRAWKAAGARGSAGMESTRVGHGRSAEVLSSLSNNEHAGSRVNYRRRKKPSKPKGACEHGSARRSGRNSGRHCPNGPTRSGKRRPNHNAAANRRTHRQCGVHATAVDQLSLMLAASQLGDLPACPPPTFGGDFVLTGDVIFDEEDDDAGCVVDHYTERASGATTSPQRGVEDADPEQDAIAAVLAQTYDTTNRILEEHATRHQDCILRRWRAQQHYDTHTDEAQRHDSHTHEPGQDSSAPQKLELIDEIEDTGNAVDQVTPKSGSRSTGESGYQSPVADAPDSPADEHNPSDDTMWDVQNSAKDAVAAEQVAQAADLKEQGHALMAAGDYINAGGTFGIARRLNPADAELRELEATADRMAESAVERVHWPATKRCSQYSRMYDAWLSSERPEIASPVSMAVC